MGYNSSFRFKAVKSNNKRSIFEVTSLVSGTTFYHVVEKGTKGYPESSWPEKMTMEEALNKFNKL
jgi:hypothetical protein